MENKFAFEWFPKSGQPIQKGLDNYPVFLSDPHSEAQLLLSEFLVDFQLTQAQKGLVEFRELALGKIILDGSVDLKNSVRIASLIRLIWLHKEHEIKLWAWELNLERLLAQLFKEQKQSDFDNEGLEQLLFWMVEWCDNCPNTLLTKLWHYTLPILEKSELTKPLQEELRRLRESARRYYSKPTDKKLENAISDLLE